MDKVKLDEPQRQIVLLALFNLKSERPGWTFAIEEIENILGGQIDWPNEKDKICTYISYSTI